MSDDTRWVLTELARHLGAVGAWAFLIHYSGQGSVSVPAALWTAFACYGAARVLGIIYMDYLD